MVKQKDLRSRQLLILGWIAAIIGPWCAFMVRVVYQLPFPQSISETATLGNKTGWGLPFCLGMLFIFSASYSWTHSYKYWLDKLSTAGMALGFFMVAVFPVASEYMTEEKVGLFRSSPEVSSILHYIGALLGFGCLVVWMLKCFTKSNRPPESRTFEKKVRNMMYNIIGIAIIFCIITIISYNIGLLHPQFALVFWLEFFILEALAIGCWVKSGMFIGKFFKDK